MGTDLSEKDESKRPPRVGAEAKIFEGADPSDPKDLLATIRRYGEQVRKELKESTTTHKTAKELKDEFEALKAQAPQQVVVQRSGSAPAAS